MRRRMLSRLGVVCVLMLTARLVVPADAEWHAQREHRWLSVRLGLSHAAAVRDFVLNVAIFVPVGFMLARRRQTGHGLTAADVAANTIGAGLGAGLGAYRSDRGPGAGSTGAVPGASRGDTLPYGESRGSLSIP